MSQAYYMKFTRGHHGSENRVGGQPTYIPAAKPWSPEEDVYFAFALQLAVDGVRLSIPNACCIQFWQTLDESADQTPQIILVPPSSTFNTSKKVPVHPLAQELDIHFEMKDDPDEFPSAAGTLEQANLFKSKLGGLDCFAMRDDGAKFLGQISEATELNLAGMMCLFYLNASGGVEAELY